jgi:hypothetical protein
LNQELGLVLGRGGTLLLLLIGIPASGGVDIIGQRDFRFASGTLKTVLGLTCYSLSNWTWFGDVVERG